MAALMAEAARRDAPYADLEAVPDHWGAEIIDGTLETPPRPRPRRAMAAAGLGGASNLPFDALPVPFDDLFPFDDPAAPPSPSPEA